MSFFSFKKKPTLSLVFDIRDSYLSIAACRFEKAKKPEIILCQDFKIESHDRSNHQKYLNSMLKALDTGILSVRKDLVKIGNTEKIGKYSFFVGSPWSVSQSKMIKVMKDKQFEINNKLIEKIITDEEDLEKKEIEDEKGLLDWRLLEEKVVQSKLNGYKTDVTLGKKTKDLEIELFVSFIPKDVKEKLLSFEKESFRRYRLGRLNSCTMSSYSFLRDLYPDKNDFIYIDVGDFVTEAYIVRDDVIQCTVSIPLGKKQIIKSASARTQTPEDVLLSALHVTHRGDNALPYEKANKIAKDAIKDWLRKLNEPISNICAEINIPKNIFFTSNDELTDILITEIKNNAKTGQFNVFNKDMKITDIDENVLNNFILNAKNFNNEPHIKMDLVFLDKLVYQV